MLKGIVVLLVLAIGGLVVVYFAGGYGSFDPSQQGKEAKAAIEAKLAAGKTTWRDVIKIAGKPQQVQYIILRERNGEKYSELGGINENFDETLLANDIKNKVAQHGFQFTYNYSGAVRFSVGFDGAGTAEGVGDEQTVGSLLGG